MTKILSLVALASGVSALNLKPSAHHKQHHKHHKHSITKAVHNPVAYSSPTRYELSSLLGTQSPMLTLWTADIAAIMLEGALIFSFLYNPYEKSTSKSTLDIFQDEKAYIDTVGFNRCSRDGTDSGLVIPWYCPIAEWAGATFPYSSAFSVPGFLAAGVAIALAMAPATKPLTHFIPITAAIAPIFGLALLAGSFWTMSEIVTNTPPDMPDFYVKINGVALLPIFAIGGFSLLFIGMVAHLVAFAECVGSGCGANGFLLPLFGANVGLQTLAWASTGMVYLLVYLGAFANNDVSKIIRQWSHGTWTSLFTSGSIFLVSQLTVIWLVLLGIQADTHAFKK